MSARTQLSAIALLVIACGFAAAASGAKPDNKQKGIAYRWVDEHGVVHYGDRLPAKYSDTESSILNKQGVEVGRLEGSKTAEQLAEERRREEQLLRQKQHDRFLLATYASVAEIEHLRDERLGQIAGQRSAAQQYIDSLQSRLGGLQRRAMKFKPYSSQANARRMPDDLAEDLARTVNELRAQRNALLAKDQEEALLRSQFAADIERFKQLNAARARR